MISSKEIESQILKYPLYFLEVRKDEVENARLPMFADSFADYVESENKIPNQIQFIQHYFKKNSNMLIQYDVNGIEARARRAYPSIVRDYHFASLLYEAGLGDGYDKRTDIEMGVDHIIRYKGDIYYLHCFVSTIRSQYWRDKKNNRHCMIGNHIEVIMDMKRDGMRVGAFYLYSNIHIERLKNTIERLRQTIHIDNSEKQLTDYM